jgi:peptidyl-prolyl cis-trans isomerase SDCCAG10
MANSGRKNDNGSQFFLTLGDTKELTGKNTLFGKIVGDTIYNLVRMGELETDKATERPSFPPKILSTEVLVNPFDDLKPQEVKPKVDVLEKPKKQLARGKGRKALLSFGGDEDGEPVVPVKKKPKFDTRIVVAGPEGEEKLQIEKSASKPSKMGSNAATTTTARSRSLTPPPVPTPKTRKRTPPPIDSRSPSPPPSKSEALLAQTNAQIAALKKSLRRPPSPPPTTATAASAKKKSLLALQKAMLPTTSVQGRKRKRGKKAEDEDEEAFRALQKFRAKLAAAPVSKTPPLDPQAQIDHEVGSDGNSEREKANEEEQDPEAALCDLHFIPNCQSCSSWDKAIPHGERGE